MRKSKTITLTILGSAMLVAGCGESNSSANRQSSTSRAVRTLYDKDRNPVPREKWFNENGDPAELYDENGFALSADEVRAEAAAATTFSQTSTTHSTTQSRRSPWLGPMFFSSRPIYSSGGSRYPTSPVSRPAGTSSGSTYFGGSRPGTTSKAPTTSRPSSTSSGSVSRGGFGSIGSAIGGSIS